MSGNTEALHRLLYISRAAASIRANFEEQVYRIAEQSDAVNRAQGVTGLLMGYDGWFVQALEGPLATLTEVYRHIAKDPRHRQIKLVSVEAIAKREFAQWGMKAGRTPAMDELVQLDALTTADLVVLLQGALGTDEAGGVDILRAVAIVDTLLI